MSKKILFKISAGPAALLLIAVLLLVANSFLGNPFSARAARNNYYSDNPDPARAVRIGAGVRFPCPVGEGNSPVQIEPIIMGEIQDRNGRQGSWMKK